MAENAPVTVSPSLRDKIRLFEGKGASPSDVRTNKLSSSFPLSRSAHLVKERVDSSINNTKKRAPIIPSFPIPVSPLSLTPTIPSSSHPCATLPDGSTLISPRKWNVITVDPESTHHHDSDNNTINNIPQQHNNKGKEKVVKTAEERLPISDSSSDEAQSSRKSSKSSKFSRRPSIEKYEEEVIKLKRMTTEEKEMVKALVKLTTQKNKMLDNLETSIQKERELLASQVESEKASLAARLEFLDSELTSKARELSLETLRNNDLADKVIKLERDRQDVKMALAASKREHQQCKVNCDAELNKKTQNLMDMAIQLTALTCLRQSMNCIICEEKIAVAVLQPCHHMVLCGACSHKVVKCPMCRVDIRSKFEVLTRNNITTNAQY